jgi:hypothetical protein
MLATSRYQAVKSWWTVSDSLSPSFASESWMAYRGMVPYFEEKLVVGPFQTMQMHIKRSVMAVESLLLDCCRLKDRAA